MYNAPTGGAQLGPDICRNDEPVGNGLFTAVLNFGNQFSSQPTFLEVAVRANSGRPCDDVTGYVTLAPRHAITPTPYAVFSSKPWDSGPNSVYYTGGNVGIGTNTPGFPLTFPNTLGDKISLWGHTGNHYGFGVQGNLLQIHTAAPGADIAFGYGSSETFAETMRVAGNGNVGIGTPTPIFPLHVATPAPNVMLVESPNTIGTWSRIRNTSSGGRDWVTVSTGSGNGEGPGNLMFRDETAGITHLLITSSGNVGVGTTAPTQRLHVRGGTGTSTQGVRITHGSEGSNWDLLIGGTANSFPGGFAIADEGGAKLTIDAAGAVAVGTTASGNARLRAVDSVTTGIRYGIQGSTASSSGYGVRGEATHATGTTFGVYGHNASANGYGVFGNGRIGASGTKSMMIDHPLGPAEKFLLHYCTESPEPQNAYNGVATLDDKGHAWIELPHYFAEINTDFRYQLTAIGAAAPGLHIATEITFNRFEIAGGTAGQRVSWEVKARRNDAFVRAYGAPVEIEKDEEQRGRYLRPELFGQPNSRQLGGGSDTSSVVDVD